MSTDRVFGQMPDGRDVRLLSIGSEPTPVVEVLTLGATIHRLLVETTELARALEAIVESTKSKLQPALRDLNDVIAFLNQQDDQLQHVLDVMAPAARYVANAAGNGPWVDLFAHEPALPADDVACRMRNDCR